MPTELVEHACMSNRKPLVSGVIHNPKAYVRDFYFFKRSQYPQLSLIHVDPEEAYNAMQNNVFYLKLLEIGKTLKSLAMLMRPDQVCRSTDEL